MKEFSEDARSKNMTIIELIEEYILCPFLIRQHHKQYHDIVDSYSHEIHTIDTHHDAIYDVQKTKVDG